MNYKDIAVQRVFNQQIAQPTFTHPHDVVGWLGAVQAQDYLGALWAVGLRTPGATEQTIEQALATKTIIRTWPMRGTIHFVAASDIRWMLKLLAPRVMQRAKSRHAQLELDEATISKSAQIITTALQGGNMLTRNAIYMLLEQANIATASSRGLHILGRLAHDQLICFAAREGKQPTFALLEEWAPNAKSLPREEALATLAERYFISHGPATIRDLMWWSGLTTKEVKAALATVAPKLGHEKIGEREYYFAQSHRTTAEAPSEAFLLPPFDEFLVAYRDRSAVIDASEQALVAPGANGIFNPIIVMNGRVVGLWKRLIKGDNVSITLSPFDVFNEEQLAAITATAEQYGRFLGKNVTVVP